VGDFGSQGLGQHCAVPLAWFSCFRAQEPRWGQPAAAELPGSAPGAAGWQLQGCGSAAAVEKLEKQQVAEVLS